MAKHEGGGVGGGLGWLVVGVILGVTATLAFQIFARRSDKDEAEAPQARTLTITQVPAAPVAKPHRRIKAEERPALAAPLSDAAAIAPDAPVTDQVAEDAAAAGMTSRSAN